MAAKKAKLEVTDSEGRLYDVFTKEDWWARADEAGSPAWFSTVKAWSGTSSYGTTDLYFNEDVLNRIEDSFTDNDQRWAVIQAFRPPMAGLTLDDFMAWASARIREELNSYRGYGRTYVPRIAPYERRASGWREEAVKERSGFTSQSSNRYHSYGAQYAWASALATAWAPIRQTQRSAYDYAQELILLNEYLEGEGVNFDGSFGDYIEAEPTSSLQDKLDRYILSNHGRRDELLTYMQNGKVAHFVPAAQLRTRKLLLEQDRPTWAYLIKSAPKYNKGKSHEHLQKLLEDFRVAAGEEKLDFKLYSESELRREYTLLVAESVLFEGPYYNPAKLHGLASVALKAVPSEHELTRFRREYSHVLHLIRSEQEAEQERSELMAMLAEDSDQADVQAAAAQAGKLTLMQLSGILMATFHPRSWIRGSADNGPYVLVELIQAEGLREVAQLLGDIILTSTEPVPTETEWRKAIGTIPMASSGFFLPLVVSPRAMSKNQRRSFPEVVGEARAYFGSDTNRW